MEIHEKIRDGEAYHARNREGRYKFTRKHVMVGPLIMGIVREDRDS